MKQTAYLGDCMEAMSKMTDNQYDLAVVDAPYGININMNMGIRKNKRKSHKDKKWDKSPNEEYFKELFRVSKNQIIWGGNYYKLPVSRAWIFWDKQVPDGVSFADGELAWTNYDKTLVKTTIPYSGFIGSDSSRIHPTQKPVALYNWIFKNYAKEEDKILDTHLGSGSSRIAAYEMNLYFDGFELDREYFEAQEKRFNNHISQLKMF